VCAPRLKQLEDNAGLYQRHATSQQQLWARADTAAVVHMSSLASAHADAVAYCKNNGLKMESVRSLAALAALQQKAHRKMETAVGSASVLCFF
jgi:hypothetical protein